MATQPNHGRDIKIDILRVLAEAPTPVSSTDIASALHIQAGEHRPLTECMAAMDGSGWLKRTPPAGGRARWSLTDEGRRVAEARGLVRRAEG